MKKYTREELIALYTPHVIAYKGTDIGRVEGFNTDIGITEKMPLTRTSLGKVAFMNDLPSIRTLQREFKTINAFREALGLPRPPERVMKPKKPLSDIITVCAEYLRQNHSIWDVQRPYRYDDVSRPFPLALKNKEKRTDLFEFIDAPTGEDLDREITRLEKKHKTISNETRFFSKAYNVWVINIDVDSKLTAIDKRLKKQWTLISTEDFRNLFKK